MKYLNMLLLFTVIVITGCNSGGGGGDAGADTPTQVNPKIPGTDTDFDGEIRGVEEVSFDTSTVGQVSIKWKVPSLYLTEDYQVVLYKVRVSTALEGFNVSSPDDSPDFSSFELIRGKNGADGTDSIGEYLDEDVFQNTLYYYWIYIVLGGSTQKGSTAGEFSSSPRYEILTSVTDTSEDVIPDADFWTRLKFDTIISPPVVVGDEKFHTLRSFDGGQPRAGEPKGRISCNASGSYCYLVETKQNRVIILDNALLKSCAGLEQGEDVDDATFQIIEFACRLQAAGSPMQVLNILGQSQAESTKSCQEYNTECSLLENSGACEDNPFCRDTTENDVFSCSVDGSKCLTAPTDVAFTPSGKFLIMDAGNSRIKVHSSDPDIGCDENPTDPADSTVRFHSSTLTCAASSVIGKKSLNDFEEYSLAEDGLSALFYPTSAVEIGEDLLIADAGIADRVVKIKGWRNSNDFTCNEDTWGTPLCDFDGLLGQSSYFNSTTFKSECFDGTSCEDYIGSGIRLTEEKEGYLLSKFNNPVKLVVEDNGGLLIGVEEDFNIDVGTGNQFALKGRILYYAENPLIGEELACDAVQGELFGEDCQATKIFGQNDPDNIFNIGSSLDNYDSGNFALLSIGDMTLRGNELFVADYERSHLYYYNDISTLIASEGETIPATVKILNPEGAAREDVAGALPDLKSLGGVHYDTIDGKVFLTDPVAGKIFEVSTKKFPTAPSF